MRSLASKALAEFLGTFVMVLIGCGAAAVNTRFPGAIAPGGVPVAFGLAVTAMIYSVGHISGAHFNPAVTLAFAVGRHFPGRHLLVYWFAQFAGAIAAAAAVAVLVPGSGAAAVTTLNTGIAVGLAWEILLTFVLMFVIVSVATDTRAVGMMAGVAIGAAVTMGAMVGGPLTGASMNPARSLGPALIVGDLANLWIYVIGPAIGAMLAAVVYGWIKCEPAASASKDLPAKGCC